MGSKDHDSRKQKEDKIEVEGTIIKTSPALFLRSNSRTILGAEELLFGRTFPERCERTLLTW